MTRKFQEIIKKYQRKQNLVLVTKNLCLIITLYLIFQNLFFIFHSFTTEKLHELFLFGISLKVVLGLVTLYLILETNNRLISIHKAARLLDIFNNDDNDTYQNALELFEQRHDQHQDVIDVLCQHADKKASNQVIIPDTTELKTAINTFVITVLVSLIFSLITPAAYIDSWYDFALNREILPDYKDHIELKPGDISVTKNSEVEIEVVKPELNLTHTLYYRFYDNHDYNEKIQRDENKWRSETLYNNWKVFNNLDRNTEYYIDNPFAVSDTFRILVFEEPAVKNLTLRYSYPSYTNLESETDYQSNGNIRAISNTSVNIELEANNPLQEAVIIFSDGNVKTMERMGRASFEQSFQVLQSGSYYFQLEDFLGNKSRRVDRMISMTEDKPPEIKIVYPGKDTIFSQNMMQPLTFFASDDFGLANLKLNYYINDNEAIKKVIQEDIAGNIFEHDYIFDLSDSYMLPGDVVTYWAEITDNAPNPQTSQSKTYRLRFPSVEEIFAEIEREEQQKMQAFNEGLESSRSLQEDFERKRRDMMKRDEFDWEDKHDLEQFLDRQEDINKMVENLAQEYEDLLNKFQDNPSLSQETLDKMERIKELMEEIADDRMKSVMEEMRSAMDKMDRDEILKLMEDFKFSMEDFDNKLQNTLDLLQNIKKEQSLQKTLAISKEMEQMQQKLLERTTEQETESSILEHEQQVIKDKLEALTDQLEDTIDQMDTDKDSEILEMLNEIKEQLNQEGSIEDNIDHSIGSLQDNNMEAATIDQQQALQQMQQMTAQLTEISEMMMQGSMDEMFEIVQKTIRRLLTLSGEHQNISQRLVRDPFPIYPNLIAGYDTLQLILQKLYSSPEIVLFITPKFIMDADMTISAYREMFHHIVNSRNPNINNRLVDVQKGLNLMIFNLLQTTDNMQQGGGGGGMESFMQAMQQMGEEQMSLNMLTQELLEQLSQGQGSSHELRQQMQRIAAEEERLAENLKRMMETNPEAQKQANAINQMIEELESVSRNLRRNRLDESVIEQQERILSRLLDAHKSIHQREFSEQRRGETREFEDWNMPEEIRQEFQRLRQQSLLEESFRSFPREYQELIREYLRIINRRAIE